MAHRGPFQHRTFCDSIRKCSPCPSGVSWIFVGIFFFSFVSLKKNHTQHAFERKMGQWSCQGSSLKHESTGLLFPVLCTALAEDPVEAVCSPSRGRAMEVLQAGRSSGTIVTVAFQGG